MPSCSRREPLQRGLIEDREPHTLTEYFALMESDWREPMGCRTAGGARRGRAQGWVYLLAISMAVTACDCSKPDGAVELKIIVPEDDANLTLADDENPDVAGVQFTVLAEAPKLDEGDEVELFLEASSADVDPPVASATVDDAGMVVFSEVTFPAGEHHLQARARMGGVQSNTVRITVADACATITFVTPERDPAASELTLGPGADTDGEACGETFETTVVVSTDAGDGQPATIFVNDTPRGTVNVEGSVARFTGVGLDNRGSTANTIEVEVENTDGVACRASFPTNVFVDCDGVSCAITRPDTASTYLNMDDDTSDDEGFQTTFDVTSDTDAVGQPVRLIVDGDESGAREVDAMADGGGALASFGNVPLSEGTHLVQAVCQDGAGNIMRSGAAEWIVDITPCGVAIAEPADGALFTPLDDVDDATSGVQIDVSGTSSGDGCASYRTALCGGIDGTTLGSLTDGAFATTVTLATSASQDVCAQVRDEAGNIGESTVTIDFRSDAPQLEILTPAGGTLFNRDGDGSHTGDLDTSTPSCNAAFEVRCTDVGVPVTLRRESGTTALSGGTADCVATAGLPSPYNGVATFSSVTLPTSASFNVVAEQTVGGLVGTSAPITLGADCIPPNLAITRPLVCPATLRPATDDEDTSAPGFQYEVRVQNPDEPPLDVTLTITDSGGSVIYTETSTTRSGLVNVFPDADFGAGGDLTVEACATDSFGNTTCVTCAVVVEDLPTVSIMNPAMNAVLDDGDDCDGSASGMQVRVQGTTDADPGSTVSVDIAGTVTTGSVMAGSPLNTFDVCADAPEGSDMTLRVTITDSRGSASATRTITVDSLPPDTAISDLAVGSIVDRRAGRVRLTWTAVDDAGGRTLVDYRLRCSESDITNESEWSSATSVPVTTDPEPSPTAQSETFGIFRSGTTLYCVLRGADAAGALTPMGPSVEVTVPFLEQEVTEAGSTALGDAVAAVGDVNGDGIDDVLIGGDGEAYLYFGSSTGLSGSPSVTFSGTGGTNFGARVASIGDFDGDGIGDFVISAHGANSFKGAVFLFYGRDGSDPAWPAAIDAEDMGCGADICFRSDDGAAGGPDDLALLGWAVAPAGDFNGDGFHDLLIGATGASGFNGRIYVILGSGGFGASTNVSVPGASGSQPAGFVAAAPAGAFQLGNTVTGLGDTDGDGYHDIVTVAPGSTSSSIDSAIYYVAGRPYPGAATGLVTLTASDLAVVDTGAPLYGAVVSNIGDFDGNGRVDLAVFHDNVSRGGVTVYRGSSSGFSSSNAFTITNTGTGTSGDEFGVSIAVGRHPWLGVLGDLDADGETDLLTGSDQAPTAPGALDLFYGFTPSGDFVRADRDVLIQPASSAATARRKEAYVGDINGDGFPAFALGDPAQSSGAGRVILHY